MIFKPYRSSARLNEIGPCSDWFQGAPRLCGCSRPCVTPGAYEPEQRRTDTAPPHQARSKQGACQTDLTEWSGSGRGTEIDHLGSARAGQRAEHSRATSRASPVKGGPGEGKGKHEAQPKCFHTPPLPRRFFGSFCIAAKGTRPQAESSISKSNPLGFDLAALLPSR